MAGPSVYRVSHARSYVETVAGLYSCWFEYAEPQRRVMGVYAGAAPAVSHSVVGENDRMIELSHCCSLCMLHGHLAVHRLQRHLPVPMLKLQIVGALQG
jgi:hypothetical protein